MKKHLQTLFRTPFRGLGVIFLFISISIFSQSYGDSGWRLDSAMLDARFPAMARSEERRVGKEC